MDFENRDIISITDFSKEEILLLCRQAALMRQAEKSGHRYDLADSLKHRKLSYMFYEPSTRTKTSFVTAIKELGGQVHGFSGTESTSVTKKETIRDTIKMMEANHFDVIVMRHPKDGSLQWAADCSSVSVINGGDGKNEHPTQALLDVFTLYLLRDGCLDGVKLGFGGDLAHGRTVRSLSLALSHFSGVTIYWAAEDALGMPSDLVSLLKERGVNVMRERSVADVLAKVDAYYMTRPQLERMEGLTPAKVAALMSEYRITVEKLKNSSAKLLHPLPVNSEVAEIEYEVYALPNQAFFAQAENGIFMRKAILHQLLKGSRYVPFSESLPSSLIVGNNRLKRTVGRPKKSGSVVADIDNGMVIDHITSCGVDEIVDALALEQKGVDYIPAHLHGHARKSLLKSYQLSLSERELKVLALKCPEATINIIRGSTVVEKFVYLLCQNTNCISRVIIEDVPPKFYSDGGIIRCRYCRRSYHLKYVKASEEEIASFLKGLPEKIE